MKLLKTLTQAASPSGNEERIREVIKAEIAPLVDEVYTDKLGNLIAHKKGEGEKVLLDAHMDEIGIIVTYIEDEGFLRFSNLGGLMLTTAVSQRVRFLNGTVGVVYMQNEGKAMSDLYIDIGATSKEEAEEKVKVGDVACFEGAFETVGDRIVSKALDDRVGCYVLIETLKKLDGIVTKNDLYFMFSVSEELGLRGAKAAAPAIAPDFSVSVDVTRTGDVPSKTKMAVKLGKGAAIKIKDNSVLTHPYMKNFMTETCKEYDIPYQMEVLEAGGTNTGAIHTANGGVVSGCISIPTRFIHTPNEMVDKKDVDAAIALLTNLIQKGFTM